MTNIVMQQINIADYKNIFLMPITSNYRLMIINGPSDMRIVWYQNRRSCLIEAGS